MANRKSRYEWKVATPMMVMPDGTCRSFDTFTSDELKEWGIRANERALRAAGFIPINDNQRKDTPCAS